MVGYRSSSNILMELKKVCQHPYLTDPDLEDDTLPAEEQQRLLIDASGKLLFLKQLLPRLKERGHRVLLFSQYKIALDRIEDFIYGQNYRYLRLDGDVSQINRQKDMDKFNAPDSDYFIFLLTTRAGGVGINLASADTVIIHDPDFNPHQDLQAISRAQRYGQTKRVLVFKLMMKNTVEEQIINNSKRKLVLDHLVVQQLNKESDQGEIDNLILHGAQDMYKDEDEDTAVHWTPDRINDLIDGAEREAELAALIELNRDEEELGGFSFARVWESGQLKNVENDANDDDKEDAIDDFDANGWASFVQSENQRAEAQRIAEEKLSTRAARQGVQYRVPDEDEIFSSSLETPRHRRANSGPEFVAPTDSEPDSDDDDGVPVRLDELNYEQRAVLGGLGMGKRRLTQYERELLRQYHAKQASAAGQSQGRSASVPPSPPTAGPGPSTLAHRAAAKSPPMKWPLPSHPNTPTTAGTSMGSGSGSNVQRTVATIRASFGRAPHKISSPAIHAAKISAAEQTLNALYDELNRLRRTQVLVNWNRVANPKNPANERKRLYITLAEAVASRKRKETSDFLKRGSIDTVFYYIDAGVKLRNPLSPQRPITAVTPGKVRASPSPKSLARPLSVPAGLALTEANTHSATSAIPKGANVLPAASPSRDATPESTPPFMTPPEMTPLPLTPPNLPQTTTPPPDTGIELPPDSLASTTEVRCYWCHEGHHLRDCPQLEPLEQLESYRIQLEQSDATQAEKNKGLAALEKLMQAATERDAQTARDKEAQAAKDKDAQAKDGAALATEARAEVTPHNKRARSSSATGSASYQPALGTPRAPIVIDESDEETPTKRARPNGPLRRLSRSAQVNGGEEHSAITLNGTAARPQSATKSTPKTLPGCRICGATTNHTASNCPVVLAGPASMTKAMERYDSSDPVRKVLSTLLRVQQNAVGVSNECPYCLKKCERTVRECVESRGSRKHLKRRIRELEGKRAEFEALTKHLSRRGDEGAGETTDSATKHAQASNNFTSVCTRLDFLYEAYLQWPNPKASKSK